VIAWVFGGYIGATLIGLIGSPRSSSRRRAAARIGALAGFAIVAGVLSVVMLRARGSPARSSCSWSGRPWARCSRSLWAAA